MDNNRLSTLTYQMEADSFARGFSHLVRGVGLAGDQKGLPLAYLEEKLGRGSPFVVAAQKAAVDAMTTGNTSNVANARLGLPFLDVFRRTTILGQLSGVLPVPPNTLAPLASGGTPATWVAEFGPMPVTRFDVDTAAVPISKIGLIAVFAQEFLRATDDRAVSLTERVLQFQVRRGENRELLSNNPAVPQESSAGLLFGLTPVASGSPSSLTEDLLALWSAVRSGEAVKPHYILSPNSAIWLRAQRSNDGPVFPDVNPVSGGNLLGVPVVLAVEAQSKIVLIDASCLAVADDGLTVDSSQTGALQMRDDPVAGATALVSLWQSNAVAIKLARYLAWALAYDDAVAFIQLDLPAAGSPS